MERLKVYTTGDSIGNSVALFSNRKREYCYQEGATELETEFNAVILALKNTPPESKVNVYTSSDLVKGYLSEDWRVTLDELKALVSEAKGLIEDKQLDVKIYWIPKDENIAGLVLRRHLAKERKKEKKAFDIE